ncbi:MAG: DUF115 domain-containing protein [Methylophilaceae bacterium]
MKENSLYYKTRLFFSDLKSFFYEVFLQYINRNNDIDSLIRNRIKKKFHHPKRIFVIGNGPSINKQNLEFLKDEFTICANSFFLKFKDISWKPTIYVVEDSLSLQCAKKYIETDHLSLKILPYSLKKNLIENNSMVFLNFRKKYLPEFFANWPFFSNRISSICFWGGTVSYFSLQIAAHFKPKEIILIGTDMNYKIPESININGLEFKNHNPDLNHFHPDYLGHAKKWNTPNLERMQRSFNKAYKFLASHNIKLINATEGGNLKNVPRKKYCNLFN